jgi:antitoxin ParD1/3/4
MTLNVSLNPHFENMIKAKVESGLYNSASEVIREGLRLLEEQDSLRQIKLEMLRAEIQKGRNSGKGKPAEEVLDRLERKYLKMAEDVSK